MPFQLALGTAPGDVAAHLVGLSVGGRVEVFQEVASSSGRSLGRKWLPAEKGQALKIQDQVKTYPGARARLQFTDQTEGPPPSGPSIFNIGGDTVIAISEFKYRFDEPIPARGIIDLIRGKIRHFIRGLGQNSDFSVRAGVSVCRLRDAEAEVEYDPDSGRLLVQAHKGKVVVTSPYVSRIVKQGKSAMFIDGKDKSSGGPS